MLYKLEIPHIQKSERTKIASLDYFGLKEKDLENFLSSRLTDVILEDDLMLIAQERPFREEADILALDKDGVLYIFELKRWESNQENLLQVLRYGQKFGRYTYDDLEKLAKDRGVLQDEESLDKKHQSIFEDSRLQKTDFNRDQVFVLVTNGADEETLAAANYWSSKGLKVACVPYDVFNIDGHAYLQIKPYSPAGKVAVERDTMYYIVNTNVSDMPNAWQDMIGDRKTGKAAAYYYRKNAIHRIQPKCKVYLYHTGVGVIAQGESTSPFQLGNGEDGEEEHYVPLKFEWAYEQDEWQSKVPTAREINQRLMSGHRFRQTVFSISKNTADTIGAIAEEKRQRSVGG